VTTAITVRHNASSRSYDALAGAQVVGTMVYQLEDRRTIAMHTIVEPGFCGQGIGTQLVREALDDIRARGMTLTSYCGFVWAFLRAHPEYADLIDTVHPGYAPRG
jgi:uncharacterized protein